MGVLGSEDVVLTLERATLAAFGAQALVLAVDVAQQAVRLVALDATRALGLAIGVAERARAADDGQVGPARLVRQDDRPAARDVVADGEQGFASGAELANLAQGFAADLRDAQGGRTVGPVVRPWTARGS